MVSGDALTPQPQAQRANDGDEPKPISYVGGPLAGQTRADDYEARRVVIVDGVEEVYYRTDITVKKHFGDDAITIECAVMAYHGPKFREVIPRSWKRKQDGGGDEEEAGAGT